jgi:8-oxo-dGTP pyrophosphatase MutT (NUDIX family)|tara:strand:- start:1165 stop:1725 length:561 start_codon:yes stop_codon:yes gene_type:complete
MYSPLINKFCSNYSSWKKNAKESYSTQWFKILKGNSFYSLEHNEDQVMILATIEKKSILLVKVKRTLLCDSAWELPAGGVMENENLDAGASREFLEETGIKIKDLTRFKILPSFVLASNRMPMFPNIFQIDLSKKDFDQRSRHDDEIEKVEIFEIKKIKQMIQDGELCATLPIAVISRYLFQSEAK